MKLKEGFVQEVLNGSINSIYKNFRLLRLDVDPEDKEYIDIVYKDVKYGIRLKFDILYVLEDMYTIKEKGGFVVLKGNAYKLEEFWEEMENREDLMRKALYEFMVEEGVTIGRVS